MGGTADGGMGHGAGGGKVQQRQQQKQHLSSAAPRPGLLFLGKVGQCKLPLPVDLVSEGER